MDSVTVYDSLFTSIDDGTMHVLEKLFGRKVTVEMAAIQKQVRSKDCGLFAIAVLVSLAHYTDPAKQQFNQSLYSV